ncbi:phosphatases II [Laetiporus sulphureus 93-53]|uniref:Phosphatases II n=1 Tax=Laetiporus sulphureus 93-53 TaxID=1314785 RepID=A0A165FBX1_9APHY|nr:phosphatases II [Laetiporus sulphureus 93-53]KZT08735.1 phosphatases II [Laetiporus sulphureus 93-53]
MLKASSTVPEWLIHCNSPPHIAAATQILSHREGSRANARNESRRRTHPSAAHRLVHLLPFVSDNADFINYYSVSVGCSALNEVSNRYSDITPYDRTRVVVSEDALDKGDRASLGGRYLNANWVRERAGGKWWIATQAPLPRTAHTFLSAISKPIALPHLSAAPSEAPAIGQKISRIRTVVQLTQNLESGMRKAHVYFPEQKGESWEIVPEDGRHAPSLRVTLLETKRIDDALCIQSTVSIEPLTTVRSEPTVFRHMLYGTWPDHGVPNEEHRSALLRFVRLVDEVNRDLSSQPHPEDLDPDPPIIVNCSAGVGRTGAFIALCSLLRVYGFLSLPASPPVASPLTLSPLGPLPQELEDDLVAQEIDALREQRPGMVQKQDQMVFIYEMLMAAFAERDGSRR